MGLIVHVVLTDESVNWYRTSMRMSFSPKLTENCNSDNMLPVQRCFAVGDCLPSHRLKRDLIKSLEINTTNFIELLNPRTNKRSFSSNCHPEKKGGRRSVHSAD